MTECIIVLILSNKSVGNVDDDDDGDDDNKNVFEDDKVEEEKPSDESFENEVAPAFGVVVGLVPLARSGDGDLPCPSRSSSRRGPWN